jgi:hypothetical protein
MNADKAFLNKKLYKKDEQGTLILNNSFDSPSKNNHHYTLFVTL